MNIIYDSKKITNDVPIGVGLGNFDGLHIGHMQLIDTLINESKDMGIKSTVYTFIQHPDNIIRKGFNTPLITSIKQKSNLLLKKGLDLLILDEFDENYSKMDPETFIRDILVSRLNVKLAVAGYDYSFGYKGLGNTEMLQEMGKKYGLKVIIIPPVEVDGEVVSSTLIRQCIRQGDMDKTSKLLGRPYSVTGEVINGRQVGRKLGFPTANVMYDDLILLPEFGVYITRTEIEGKKYNSITNVGINPTFSGIKKPTVETNIFDYEGQLYGKLIEVHFYKMLREEIRFESHEQLIKQIDKDISFAKEFFKYHEA